MFVPQGAGGEREPESLVRPAERRLEQPGGRRTGFVAEAWEAAARVAERRSLPGSEADSEPSGCWEVLREQPTLEGLRLSDGQ